MCRLMVVLHNGLAAWSRELRQPVGDLPDQRSRVREWVLRPRRKRQADELATTPDHRVHHLATGVRECDVRRSSIVLGAYGRQQSLDLDATHQSARRRDADAEMGCKL